MTDARKGPTIFKSLKVHYVVPLYSYWFQIILNFLLSITHLCILCSVKCSRLITVHYYKLTCLLLLTY